MGRVQYMLQRKTGQRRWLSRCSDACALSLDAGERDALHKHLLQEEEEHNDRQGDKHGSRHQERPFRAVLTAIFVDAKRERVLVLIAQVNQWSEVIAPARDEFENRHCRQSRLGQAA